MAEELKRTKRTVIAPTGDDGMRGGQVLSVELGPDEDMEWIWSHHRDRGSRVTGYKIVTRAAERSARA